MHVGVSHGIPQIVSKSLFYNNIGEDVLLKYHFQGHKDKLLIFDHFFHCSLETLICVTCSVINILLSSGLSL